MSQSDTMSPRLREALAYAAKGMHVFPCRVGRKEPATPQGFKDATTDPDKIRELWGDRDYNIGWVPHLSGCFAVDIDDKNGKEGTKNWRELPFDKPMTATVATPSDGTHYHYVGHTRSSQGYIKDGKLYGLADGVDTRGESGYVLLPPSVILPGGPDTPGDYSWLIEIEPTQGPAAEIEAALSSRQPVPLKAPDGVEIDATWMIDLARDELRAMVANGKVAVEGQAGDLETYKVAAKLGDYGLSESVIFELMSDEWNPHCQPPWDEEDLSAKVRSGLKNRQNDIGARVKLDPATIFEPTRPEVSEDAASKYPPLLTATQLAGMHFDPPTWVWQDRLLEHEPNLYTGDAGVGKTTLAENIAVAVAAGIPLLGHATKQLPVFMLVAEDTYGPVRNNLLAIKQALQAPDAALDQIHVLSVKSDKIPGGHRLVTISDEGAVKNTEFMGYLAGRILEIGPCLFVVDPLDSFATFNRYKDEPSRALSETWGRWICDELHATLLVNDHPSKASIQSGSHYAGSVQLKAAFTLFATLIGGQWSGMLSRQRDMTLSVLKGKYAGEDDTKFVRTSKSPAFVLQSGPQHQPDDHQVAVFDHVIARLDAGEEVAKTNHGYGPGEIGIALGLDEKRVRHALAALCSRMWLKKEEGVPGYHRGNKAPR